MPITPKNLVRHELIGLKVKIKESKNLSLKNLEGRIIDETYNTFKIETKDKKEKIIPKKECVFLFTLPDETKVQVYGEILVGRPEDRIKKKFKRW